MFSLLAERGVAEKEAVEGLTIMCANGMDTDEMEASVHHWIDSKQAREARYPGKRWLAFAKTQLPGRSSRRPRRRHLPSPPEAFAVSGRIDITSGLPVKREPQPVHVAPSPPPPAPPPPTPEELAAREEAKGAREAEREARRQRRQEATRAEAEDQMTVLRGEIARTSSNGLRRDLERQLRRLEKETHELLGTVQ
jgi:hypothetical protein